MARTIDLNRVATFVRVVDERGFTAAARALSLPKSSVSRSVALLEQELGVRLLQRSTRNVTLTEAGAAFYERASRGVAQVLDAGSTVADMEAALRGPIRITAPVDAGVWMLAPVISRFLKRYPDVTIDVVLTSRVVDLVEEGFDLALRAGALTDGSLIARPVGQIVTAVYGSPKYLAKHGVPQSPAELASHRCVLFRPTRGRAKWSLVRDGVEETIEVSGPLGVDDFGYIRRAVLLGLGLGILPSFISAGDVERGRLVRVLPEHALNSARLHIVYPSARYVPHRVAVLRDFLLKGLVCEASAERREKLRAKREQRANGARNVAGDLVRRSAER